MIRHLALLRTGTLLALVVACPLPFAGITPAGRTVLVVATFALFAVTILTVRDLSALRALRLPLLALVAIALLGLAQAAAWPRPWVAWVSPGHGGLYDERREALQETVASKVEEPTLSLAPPVSRSTALLWLAAAAAMATAALLTRRRCHRHALAGALVAMGLFQVLYGSQRWFRRSTEIWGVDVPGNPGRLRGTFVNPDHLAFYLGPLLAVTFAWGLWAWRRARREDDWERRVFLTVPPVLVWLTLFAGVAFTGSRSGLLAAVSATVVQGALITSRRRRRWAPVGLGVALVGLAVVAFVGFQEGLGRALSTTVFDVTWSDRVRVYAACWTLWSRFPWIGTGLGTFREALPMVEPADLEGTWRHAHNDYLELLVTAGLAGVAVLAPALVSLLGRLRRVLLHGRRSADRAAAVAVLGALAGAGVHSAFDFGLTMPANAITLAVLCGAGAGVGVRNHG